MENPTGNTAETGAPDPAPQPDPKFEKVKYFVDLAKWLITSVALVLITQIIDRGFRDREDGMKEIAQYDKYVTDLIVLNKDPSSKRNLAQFFAYVTPSHKLQDGWMDYYQKVDSEYNVFIKPVKDADSVLRNRQAELMIKSDLSPADSLELIQVNRGILQTQSIINPEIVLPNTQVAQPWVAAEARGFSALLSRNVNEAIAAFAESEWLKPSYHMVYEIRNYLQKNKNALADATDPAWEDAYQWVLSNASWGMPADVKDKMKVQTPDLP